MSVKKPPRKKSIMKPLIAGGMITFLAIAGIVVSIGILHEDELIIGLDGHINSMDPLYQPSDSSFKVNAMVMTQIIEGLFDHNQSDDAMIVPCLARDYGVWSSDYLNFTCRLRQGVQFHDGTRFNSTSVKWNIDRIHRFITTKSWETTWAWKYMYLFTNGTQIINETKIIDEYTIKFVLNGRYAPFRALLSAMTSAILSPSSTSENYFINMFTEKLIGTGPFKLDTWEMDPIDGKSGDILLKANKNYWEGKPKIDKVHFLWMPEIDKIEKIITGDIHYTSDPSDLNILIFFKNSPEVRILSSINPGVNCLTMNNVMFPLEMRKAISFALNYMDFIHEWNLTLPTKIIRCKSPLSKGMLFSDWDLGVAYFNLSLARQTLIDAAWPGTSGLTADNNISIGNEWESLVVDGTPLATYQFTVRYDVDFDQWFSTMISTYLKQIGIKVNSSYVTGQGYWEGIRKGSLKFYVSGWGPGFNDPAECVNPIFSRNATYNTMNFTDTLVQDWLDQSLEEQNETAREEMYYNIQKRLIEDLYPVAWMYSKIDWNIWGSNVKGVPQGNFPNRFVLKYAHLV